VPPWFPRVDGAVGGAATTWENAGDWAIGGLGDTLGGIVTGTGETAGQAVGGTFGSLFGGLFGGLPSMLLKVAALAAGAYVLVNII